MPRRRPQRWRVAIAAVTTLLVGVLAPTVLSDTRTFHRSRLLFSSPVTAVPAGRPTSKVDGVPVLNQGEPRVLATQDGAFYVSSHYQPFDCDTGADSTYQSCVWKSVDGGRTFHISGGEPGRQAGNDVDLAELPSGTIIQSTMTNYPPGLGSGFLGTTVSRSTDRGRTWTESVNANTQVLNDRPFLVADGPRLLLTYSAAPGNIFVNISNDDGRTFDLPRAVTALPPQPVMSINGSPGADRLRRQILVPYSYAAAPGCTSGTSGCVDTIGMATSADGGETWTEEVVARLPGGHGLVSAINVTADAAGRRYLAFGDTDVTHGRTRAAVLRQDAPGRAWVPTAALDAPGTSGMMPWVIAGRSGRVGVAWYSSTYSDAQTTRRPWTVRAATSTNAGRSWETAEISRGTAYVGSGADHQDFVWDLIALTTDSSGGLFACWTHHSGRPGQFNTIDCARQSRGPRL